MGASRLPPKRNPDFPNRETKVQRQLRAERVLALLHQHFPDAHCALHWETPFQLLVATMLSAQCTDKRVNQVTPNLFVRFPDAKAMAAASVSELEDLVRTTGFFRNKAKNISQSAKLLLRDWDGEVPNTMEALLKLPGVARKTANCVLGTAFQQPVGVVVDTHVGRIARRMGFSREANPVAVERDLMTFFPRTDWVYLSHAWIDLGRSLCTARTAHCSRCFLRGECPQRVAERQR